jgi:hypothetical protein
VTGAVGSGDCAKSEQVVARTIEAIRRVFNRMQIVEDWRYYEQKEENAEPRVSESRCRFGTTQKDQASTLGAVTPRGETTERAFGRRGTAAPPSSGRASAAALPTR